MQEKTKVSETRAAYELKVKNCISRLSHRLEKLILNTHYPLKEAQSLFQNAHKQIERTYNSARQTKYNKNTIHKVTTPVITLLNDATTHATAKIRQTTTNLKAKDNTPINQTYESNGVKITKTEQPGQYKIDYKQSTKHVTIHGNDYSGSYNPIRHLFTKQSEDNTLQLLQKIDHSNPDPEQPTVIVIPSAEGKTTIAHNWKNRTETDKQTIVDNEIPPHAVQTMNEQIIEIDSVIMQTIEDTKDKTDPTSTIPVDKFITRYKTIINNLPKFSTFLVNAPQDNSPIYPISTHISILTPNLKLTRANIPNRIHTQVTQNPVYSQLQTRNEAIILHNILNQYYKTMPKFTIRKHLFESFNLF